MRKLAAHLRGQWIGVVALFVALGGTSYAVVQLPRNSVGSGQIRKGAVNSQKVRDRTLTLRDFRASERAKLRGEVGATGAAGPTGPPGPAGPAGSDASFNGAAAGGALTGAYPAPGLAANSVGASQISSTAIGLSKLGIVLVPVATASNSTSPKTLNADCPAGTTPISGGADVEAGAVLTASTRNPFANGWHAAAVEPVATTDSWALHAIALCIRN